MMKQTMLGIINVTTLPHFHRVLYDVNSATLSPQYRDKIAVYVKCTQ